MDLEEAIIGRIEKSNRRIAQVKRQLVKLNQIDDMLKVESEQVAKKIVMAKRKIIKVKLMIEQEEDGAMAKKRELEEQNSLSKAKIVMFDQILRKKRKCQKETLLGRSNN